MKTSVSRIVLPTTLILAVVALTAMATVSWVWLRATHGGERETTSGEQTLQFSGSDQPALIDGTDSQRVCTNAQGTGPQGVPMERSSVSALRKPSSVEHEAMAAREKQIAKPEMLRLLQALDREKRLQTAALTAAPLKIAPQLEGLIGRIETSLATGADPRALCIPGVAKVDASGAVQVYVETHDDPNKALPALQAAGMKAEFSLAETRQVQGWVSASILKTLSAMAQVRHIRLPGYSHTNAGSVTTQGDALLKANMVRTLGPPGPYNGSNVKVCILSNGCANRATAVASGDLPATGITMHPALQSSGDEGTAMAEIVHDLAPGALLYAAGVSTSLEMIVAIRWAVGQRCQVICDDLGFLDQPFFEDGPVAIAARAAVADSGVVVVSAAGNEANDHYQGVYLPIPGYTYQDFNSGTGTDVGLDIHVPAGGWADIYLQWNDAFGNSSNNYDLYLLDTAPVVVVDSSTTDQSGASNPKEELHWHNTSGSDKSMAVAIAKYSGNARTLELIVEGDAYVTDANYVSGDSIFGHQAVAEVISVGAIDQASSELNTLELYSSRGPSTISFPSPETRQTPTIASVDGVSVTGAGGFASRFFGTSAAAPHVAGICALMLSKNPNATPILIRNTLASTATDKGSTGYDNSSGYGLADALAAVNSLPSPGTGAEIAVLGPSGTSVVDGGTVNFGALNPGSTARLAFTVINTGSATLSGLAISKDGIDASDFTVESLSTTNVPSGGSANFDVICFPDSTGTSSAYIHISSNDADESPFDICLQGTRVAGASNGNTAGKPIWNRPEENGSNAPASLSGFATAVPYEAFRFTVGLSGVYTIRSLALWNNYVILYSGSFNALSPLANVLQGSDDYVLQGSAGFIVNLTAGTTYILVTTGYANSKSGAYSLEITGPGAVVPKDSPDISVEHPAGSILANGVSLVDFGAFLVGGSSTKTFTIRNLGGIALTGLAVTKDASGSGDFTIVANPAATVGPGGSTTFDVEFTLGSTGTRYAVVKIGSNDVDENPFSLLLKGSSPSADANLSNLVLSIGALKPAFSGTTTSYTASIPSERASVTVTPTTADANSTVTVNGAPVPSGQPSGTINLDAGANTITTVVTAQDGTTKTIYTVVVTRDPFSSVAYAWTNLAGQPGGLGNTDGTGRAARFYFPSGLAVDTTGNLYIADRDNNTIRKASPSGLVTTLAGGGASGSMDGTGSSARFSGPKGVAVDVAGNLYVADTGNNTIRKVSPSGAVTTMVGVPGESGGIDGTSSTARLFRPQGVAVDSMGNVFVADTDNHTIRKVSPVGVVTTLAGSAGTPGTADGTGSAARFRYPSGLGVDGAGDIYVADTYNNTIRKVSTAGVVTTLAGSAGISGSADGTGSAARFKLPAGVTVDSTGNAWVADSSNHTIRKVSSVGVVTTLAGSAGSLGSVNGTGNAALFSSPNGTAVDSTGNVYVADQRNHMIRKVDRSGVVTTLAGCAVASGSVDGVGGAARFCYPSGVTVNNVGDIYVADTDNHTIRKVSPAGVATTVVGSAGISGSADGLGNTARFYSPCGVAVDGAGNLYVADTDSNTIRKVSSAGMVVTLAGSAGTRGSADGTGIAAQFRWPQGVAVDGTNTLYVADTYNHTIRKVSPSGVVTTLAGTANTSGSTDGTGNTAAFSYPMGIAVDEAGTIYVADTNNNTIRKVSFAGVVTTLAGSAGISGSADGTGSAARFKFPTGVAVDRAGNLYITDGNNRTIRKMNPAGVVTTIGGVALAIGDADGIGSLAGFTSCMGMTVGSSGILYVADSENNRISKGTPVFAPVITTSSPLPSGMVGSAYTQPLEAIGGAAPYSWSITSGSLPLELFISRGGVISGEAVAAATADFTVRVTCNDGLSSTRAFSLTINPPPPVITSATKVTTTQGQSFSYQIVATNSPASFGAIGLPEGLGIEPLNGLISGTTTLTGNYDVILNAVNASGAGTATLALNITDISYANWVSGCGLAGAGAGAMSNPSGDGVANLLKYAFNLNPSSADHHMIEPRIGTSGLPHVSTGGQGANATLRVEYIRRKNAPKLSYTVEFSQDLRNDWVSATGPEAVSVIDGIWERVVVCDSRTVGISGHRYARLRVILLP